MAPALRKVNIHMADYWLVFDWLLFLDCLANYGAELSSGSPSGRTCFSAIRARACVCDDDDFLFQLLVSSCLTRSRLVRLAFVSFFEISYVCTRFSVGSAIICPCQSIERR